jgi:alpha-L-arabinofuranosidase
MNNTDNRALRRSLGIRIKTGILLCFILLIPAVVNAQSVSQSKKISPDLFGVFFEDINYSADGGLYAELVQNRSFEFSPADHDGWNPFSFWDYVTPGFSYGKISVETSAPIHPNNPHYIVLEAEHVGHEAGYSGESGVGIRNSGFDGMVIKGGDSYNLSLFARILSEDSISIVASIQTPKGKVLAENRILVSGEEWKKYTSILNPAESIDSARLVIMLTSEGRAAFDMISLSPEKTFKNHHNGLRPDLAQAIADLKPKFIRFPGGCLVHGDGVGNIYRWKNTIGPVEERKEQKNLWGYHQTTGLGFFEFFQYCEDIGAKPLPVLPAAVSCQNSGGTWRIGGTGQRAIPMDEMPDYIKDVLDLIEWANGPVTSEWGAKRAAAGHPRPFNLEYIGIGNEDKITPEFTERFKMIYNAVQAKYPEITVIGTAGPLAEGDDFDKGWKLADDIKLPVIDEHYYCSPEWFISHQNRYDMYSREKSGVYLGEYASWGNKLRNAVSEAAYMTSLERNGDVVRMASYAPLLAKKGFTQWKTDLIFFDNTKVCPSANYYVQKLFSTNQGDIYLDKVVSYDQKEMTLAASCVMDSSTGDIILKLVNTGKDTGTFNVNLSDFRNIKNEAEKTILTGDPDSENTFENSQNVVPYSSTDKVSSRFEYSAPAMSLTVFRIRTK